MPRLRILTRGFRYLANLTDLEGTQGLTHIQTDEAFPVVQLDRAAMLQYNKIRRFRYLQEVVTQNGVTLVGLNPTAGAWDDVLEYSNDDPAQFLAHTAGGTTIPGRSDREWLITQFGLCYPDPSTGSTHTEGVFFYRGGYSTADPTIPITYPLTRVLAYREDPVVPAVGDGYYTIGMPLRWGAKTIEAGLTNTGIETAVVVMEAMAVPFGLIPFTDGV